MLILASELPEWVTPYTLRDTSASLLAYGGVGVHAAAAMLGNACLFRPCICGPTPIDIRMTSGVSERPRRNPQTCAARHERPASVGRRMNNVRDRVCGENMEIGLPSNP